MNFACAVGENDNCRVATLFETGRFHYGKGFVQQSFSISDHAIELTTDPMCPSLQIDNQLKWDKHIGIIKAKANLSLGLIEYAKKYLPSDVLNKMHRGIVEPHLSYRCSV